jgi:hypothetical protein
MLKKFLSGIIGTILLFCLTTISVTYVAKSILEGTLLLELGESIIGNTFSHVQEAGINNYVDMIFAGTSNRYPDIEKYFQNDRIQEELGTIFTNYIKYVAGIPDTEKPNITALSTYIEQSALEYEKGTGTTIDLTAPNAFLKELETNLNGQNQPMNSNLTKAFEYIYSDSVYTLPIIISLICVALLFIINWDIAAVLTSIGTSLIMNAIGTYGLGFGLKIALQKQNLLDEFATKAVNVFTGYFNKIGTISLISGIILIVLAFIYKKIKKPKQVAPPNNQFFTYEEQKTSN